MKKKTFVSILSPIISWRVPTYAKQSHSRAVVRTIFKQIIIMNKNFLHYSNCSFSLLPYMHWHTIHSFTLQNFPCLFHILFIIQWIQKLCSNAYPVILLKCLRLDLGRLYYLHNEICRKCYGKSLSWWKFHLNCTTN